MDMFQAELIIWSISICVGTLSIIGNSFTVSFVISIRKKDRTASCLVKASLACTDAISGLMIIVGSSTKLVMLFNGVTSELTTVYFIARALQKFTLVATFFHLSLFSCMRLYAIKRPHKYSIMSRKTIYLFLLLAWVLSAPVVSAYDFPTISTHRPVEYLILICYSTVTPFAVVLLSTLALCITYYKSTWTQAMIGAEDSVVVSHRKDDHRKFIKMICCMLLGVLCTSVPFLVVHMSTLVNNIRRFHVIF